jgi:hypothetical protein
MAPIGTKVTEAIDAHATAYINKQYTVYKRLEMIEAYLSEDMFWVSTFLIFSV